MTITEFLAARYAEDEQAVEDEPEFYPWADHDPGECDSCDHARQHIAANDARAARVLADIESKRGILALHGSDHVCPSGNGVGCTDYDATRDDDGMRPCPTLRYLAAPHSDHPDYDAGWAL